MINNYKCMNKILDNDSISVYICTYLEELNIEECIKSIKNNNIENIHIVDSSPNNLTADIAIKNNASVIKTKKGLAGQRQVAIEHCKTEFIMFVDADDRLDSNCVKILFNELLDLKYDGIRAKTRIYCPQTYWQIAANEVLKYCITIPGPTKMIGRPALYKTEILKKAGFDLSFNNIGNEDSALSIRMEKIGAYQGIGNGISYRKHPAKFRENFKDWKKYGYGDANIILEYPHKTYNVIKHLLYVYPIKRSWQLIKNCKGLYIGYTILQGFFRFFYCLLYLLKLIFENSN